MDAICRYITSESVRVSGAANWDETANKMTAEACDSCRFRILSDIADEEKETVTISIGRRTLINYTFISLSEETDNKTRTEIVLIVAYGEDSENNKTRPRHEYRCILDIPHKNESNKKATKEFTYKYKNVEIYE